MTNVAIMCFFVGFVLYVFLLLGFKCLKYMIYFVKDIICLFLNVYSQYKTKTV